MVLLAGWAGSAGMGAEAVRDAGWSAALPRGAGLCAFLDATAARHPGRSAFADQADRPVWSGRPAMSWTYGVAREAVGRLAAGLLALGLAPRTPVGLLMAGGAEQALALLAVEEAGHVPCLIPPAWDEAALGRAVEAARIVTLLCQGRIADARPAEAACRVAARTFGLRFVAAFGPGVPDGVIPLDEVLLAAEAPERIGFGEPAGLVTFAGDPDRPVHRGGDALVAAAAAHLVAARVGPGERVVTLLPPHDLKGVVTGLAAALLAGATLEAHGLFSAEALEAALDRGGPIHLVAPAWMEPAFARATLPRNLASTTFVHRVPTALSDRGGVSGTVLDALAIDEDAVLTRRREGRQDLGLALAQEPAGADAMGLLSVRREPDGRLAYTGPASATAPFSRGAASEIAYAGWRRSSYRVDLFAGAATAVARI